MSANAYETKGHAAAAPGLRGHSVGELYPYTVIAIGHGPAQRLTWAAMDSRTGRHGREFRTYQEAAQDAVGLLVRNLINQ
jgi:hypothetical protein